MKKEDTKGKIKKVLKYFSIVEWILYLSSLVLITLSFIIFKNKEWLYLSVGVLGVTGLIFDSKGNVVGQFFAFAFDIVYAIVAYRFGYYGEMIMYLCLGLPQATISIISWARHPFRGNKKEVEINSIKPIEMISLFLSSAVITVIFYFVLKYWNTPNLIISTISIFTSCCAVYLLIRRSRFYSILFICNDIILIALWTYACFESLNYCPILCCFVMYLFIDIYTFINWTIIKKRQKMIKDKQIKY